MMAHKQRSEEERRHIVVYLTHLRYVTVETDGKDLIRMGLPPGPHYRTVLDALLRAKLNGQITSKEDEERLARGLIVEELKLLGKPKLYVPYTQHTTHNTHDTRHTHTHTHSHDPCLLNRCVAGRVQRH